ncbi:hypothetical protein HII31_12286 [Pseudocercospora fuligena]|uniref:Uncharacterized protein n=1 Tax=Pseudocercospora fuligena TaxID=685502 RepID=A0A8H6VCM5_9PEZI|nr:hypothetical protein HII31_12286 [Pseudocercospora fuligena]
MLAADTAANGNATDARSIEPVCHLLNLAGELKNRVYRMVLLTDDRAPIIVSSRGYEKPALLQTCKEVRREAFSIFYYENQFGIEVPDYDIAIPMKFMDSLNQIWRLPRSHSLRIKVRQDKITAHYLQISSRPNWSNLMTQMRVYHRGSLRVAPGGPIQAYISGRRDGMRLAISAMSHTSVMLKDQPWERA